MALPSTVPMLAVVEAEGGRGSIFASIDDMTSNVDPFDP